MWRFLGLLLGRVCRRFFGVGWLGRVLGFLSFLCRLWCIGVGCLGFGVVVGGVFCRFFVRLVEFFRLVFVCFLVFRFCRGRMLIGRCRCIFRLWL